MCLCKQVRARIVRERERGGQMDGWTHGQLAGGIEYIWFERGKVYATYSLRITVNTMFAYPLILSKRCVRAGTTVPES